MDYYGRKSLLSSSNNSTSNASPTSSKAMNSETDFVVVVAALVCAIICVLGLIVVARCAWLRRGVDTWSFGIGGGNQLGNKGLKKKVLNSLPKYTHNHNTGEVGVEECGICLAEYGDGDEVRVLPQCGHKFHVKCIDTWLKSHASCPSCRQTLVLARCHRCGEFSTAKCKLGPVSSAPSTSSIPVLP